MWYKILTGILVVAIAAVAIFYCIGTESTNMYVVDKGMALSYTDEYGLIHDTVYWLVVAESGGEADTFTIFTTGKTWHSYAVGERYHGVMERAVPYDGDNGIAQYLTTQYLWGAE